MKKLTAQLLNEWLRMHGACAPHRCDIKETPKHFYLCRTIEDLSWATRQLRCKEVNELLDFFISDKIEPEIYLIPGEDLYEIVKVSLPFELWEEAILLDLGEIK